MYLREVGQTCILRLQLCLQHSTFTGIAKPLVGGQGESWLIDNVVLKPTQKVELTDFYCRIHARLIHEQARLLQLGSGDVKLFRVPAPIVIPGTKPLSYVNEGWTATRLLDGAPYPTHCIRIGNILPAAHAFHNALRTFVSAPHPSMLARRDRWTQSDRIAWEEMNISDATNVSQPLVAKLQPYLDRVNALKKPIATSDYQSRLVHDNSSGNVLFCTPDQPDFTVGILDFEGYWQPVEYIEAIMVADGMMWQVGR